MIISRSAAQCALYTPSFTTLHDPVLQRVTIQQAYRKLSVSKVTTMQQSVEQGLSREELQKLRNNRTGLLIFQLSWILVFVMLIVVNVQIRGNQTSWPPPGVEKLGIGLPALATLALIASLVLVHRAFNAVKASRVAEFLSQWQIAIGLGLVFVAIMAYEWIIVPVSGQYSSIFRVMTGFHGLHALVIGVMLWRAQRFVKAGVYGQQNFWPIEAAVKLWDFVIIAWLLFFAVLYVF
jgi:heme/copper-type cytochrome/quinol oxidase subunit 3